MIEATLKDKSTVISILTKSFIDNKSVSFVINNNKGKIPLLMEYCFYSGINYGKVFLSDDKKAATIILFPEKKRFSLKSILRDIKLVVKVIGITRIFLVMKREKLIRVHQPKSGIIHLWYIGVNPNDYGKGIGSKLINEVVIYCKQKKKDIYLETSTIRNFAFYEKNGFINNGSIEKGLPYKLYIFKKEI